MNESNMQTVALVTALQAAVAALMATHPDPAALLRALRESAEPLHANLLGLPTPEPALQAFQRVMEELEQRLAPRT